MRMLPLCCKQSIDGVFCSSAHVSESVMFMTALDQKDIPRTCASSGLLSRCLLRVRLLRCAGESSYVGQDHVGLWSSTSTGLEA